MQGRDINRWPINATKNVCLSLKLPVGNGSPCIKQDIDLFRVQLQSSLEKPRVLFIHTIFKVLIQKTSRNLWGMHVRDREVGLDDHEDLSIHVWIPWVSPCFVIPQLWIIISSAREPQPKAAVPSSESFPYSELKFVSTDLKIDSLLQDAISEMWELILTQAKWL